VRFENPSLSTYLRDLNESPLIPAEDETSWAERVAAGDPLARDYMVRANLRLVVSIARGFLRSGVPLEDLVSEGNLGLMRAVEGYDGTRGIRFSTYASFWIKQSIRAAVRKQGAMVRLPAYTHTLLAKWRRASAVLAERLGRTPTDDEVAKALGLSKRKLKVAKEALRIARLIPGSLDDEEHSDRDGALVDERVPPVVDVVADAEVLEGVLDRLEMLEPRQADVIRMRFGIGTDAPKSLREIGEYLGLTRERVRQLESLAMQQLRDPQMACA
jgi:RNA polymerase primary sigma factor